MLKFYPAHMPGTLERYRFDNKTLAFWEEENPFFTYPYLLISAYLGLTSKWKRAENVKNKNTFVVGDSGGFQNVTMNANLDALKVLRWLEENCDLGFVLDQPPFEYFGDLVEKNIVDDGKFKKCLEITKRNNKIYMENKTNKNLKIYNILHGHNKERLNLWYNEIKSDFFDGWATGGVKPIGDPLKQIVASMFLYDKGVRKNIHILGLSGYDVMPTLAYLSKYIENLSFDSSTYTEARRWNVFRIPTSVKMRIPLGNKEKVAKGWADEGMEKLKLKICPCSCVVCSKATKVIPWSKFYDEMDSTKSSITCLHQLNLQLNYISTLYALKDSRYLLEEFVKNESNDPERNIDSFNFIDCVVEKGFDYAYEKFKDKININLNVVKQKAKNLFTF